MPFVYYDRIIDMLGIIRGSGTITPDGIKTTIVSRLIASYIISSPREPRRRFLPDKSMDEIIKQIQGLKLISTSLRICLIVSSKSKGVVKEKNYDRIKDLIEIVRVHKRGTTKKEVIKLIGRNKPASFIVTPPGTRPVKILSDSSIYKVIRLAEKMKLISKARGRNIILSSGGYLVFKGKTSERIRYLMSIIEEYKCISKQDLADYIEAKKPASFIVTPPGIRPVKILSRKMIYKVINLSIRLGLVSIGQQKYLSLTPATKNALIHGSINLCLERKIRRYLSGNGASLRIIRRAITVIRKPPFADSSTIHSTIRGIKISKEKFGILLNLLAEIDVIKVHSGRVFYF